MLSRQLTEKTNAISLNLKIKLNEIKAIETWNKIIKNAKSTKSLNIYKDL